MTLDYTYQYEIGYILEFLQNVEWLVGVPPRSDFHEYSKTWVAGDGREVGDGFPSTEWHFDYLTYDMLNALMGFIQGASGVVAIKTRGNEGAYLEYAHAIMHRPKVGESMTRTSFGWTDVTIRFTKLRN